MFNLLAFFSNDTTQIILWVVLICALLGLVTLMAHTVIISRFNKKRKGNTTDGNAADDAAVLEDQNLDFENSDNLIMSRNVIYSAGTDGQLKTGKYVLESADSSVDKFNVRYNGLVKEYQNGDILVLADGDTISPVSGSVVLNKVEY